MDFEIEHCRPHPSDESSGAHHIPHLSRSRSPTMVNVDPKSNRRGLFAFRS